MGAAAVAITAARSPLVELPTVSDPVVSVVIVTHGASPVVFDAVSALRRHTPELPFEVLVVANPDNGQRSSELLHRSTSGVRLVEPEVNLGFGGGNHLGAGLARGELVAFVNPDLIVTEGWLPPLVRALDDPAVAIAAPVLLHRDGSVQEAGQVIFADGGTDPICGPRLFPGDRSVLFARDVDYASAACWLIRRSTYHELGGFDPAYHPAYFEDADLGLRVEAAGLVTRLVTDRPVVHLLGGGGDTPASTAIAMRRVFEQRWAATLAAHCARPTAPAEALAARDRRCRQRTLVLLSTGDLPAEEVVGAIDEVGRAAAERPRDRVTLAVDRLVDAERHRRRWCPQGLELVVGSLEPLLAARRRWATEVRWLGEGAAVLAASVAGSAPWAGGR